jgi:hypothetical protein
MSKLARALAVGVLLTAMSLGGTAHAQDDEAQPQPAGVTDPDPSQAQPPDEPTPQDPGTSEDPGESPDPGTSPEDPAPSAGTSSNPGPTTTTRPEVMPPKSLRVTVSPRTGGPGTTVTVRADLRACLRPGSGRGFFLDYDAQGVDTLARWLTSQHVSGGWYTGRYRITKNDAPGLGQFGVVCDNASEGLTSFRVQPSKAPVPVRVTPQAAARGTTVRITTEGRCRWAYIWFYDSKADGLTEAGGAKRVAPVQFREDGTLTASYTLTRRDATGPAVFRVVCGIDPDHARDGEASFRVLANGQRSGGNGQVANRNDTQLPNRIDTGQGGTTDDAAQGGLDPTRLLLPAGLLLIVVGVGLGLRHSARSRR